MVRKLLQGKLPILLAAFLLVSGPALASCRDEVSDAERDRRLKLVNWGGIGAVTAWGILNWDYFARSPVAKTEGWFGANTDEGGADKLGHMYTAYLAARAASNLYQHWCFGEEDAARYGLFSSLAILSAVEVGDSFSDYGFSYEDFIANVAGGVAGYYFERNPGLSKKFDFRWEYGLNPDGADFATDYNNSKYLLATKFAGFEALDDTFLKHFELHLGYYTRGYSEADEVNERHVYVGIGINLTDLFRRNGYRKTATVLNYYQPPGVYAAWDRDLND